jgi:hypothetical protein
MNKGENKRQFDRAEILSLVLIIGAYLRLVSNTKAAALILISSAFGRAEVYKEPKSGINTRLLASQISEILLFMLHQNLKVLKRLHFFSILFINILTLWYMCFSLEVSKIKQEHSVSSGTNKYLINCFPITSTRKKLQGNKVRNLWVDFIDFCSLRLILISDSGSTKWRIYQRYWNNVGIFHKYSSSANEGNVSCEQYKYSNIKDRRHSFYNTTKSVTCVLFYHVFLLWKGNAQQEGMAPVVTARNHGLRSVKTFYASLLPLCLVTLA